MEKKFFVLLNCVCLFSCALAITVKNCGKSFLPPNSVDRIVGGKEADHGRYPWMISLLESHNGYSYNHACGGAVLNENWIVTAAHCIDHETMPHWYRVIAGLHKLSGRSDSTVQDITVAEIYRHKDYLRRTHENDIALLKLKTPIDLNRSGGYINGICLPKTDRYPTGYATVTGWGHTYHGGWNSDTLREVVLPMVPQNICNEAYDDDLYDGIDVITEKMICAGITAKDSCQNDSGGPLFQTSSDGESTLVGIVSFGRGCGRAGFPGVYTKVSPYKDWMKNIMSK